MAVTARHEIDNGDTVYLIEYLDGAEAGLLKSSDIADEISRQQIYHDDIACRLWMFDFRSKTGLWVSVEEISNDLDYIHAFVDNYGLRNGER